MSTMFKCRDGQETVCKSSPSFTSISSGGMVKYEEKEDETRGGKRSASNSVAIGQEVSEQASVGKKVKTENGGYSGALLGESFAGGKSSGENAPKQQCSSTGHRPVTSCTHCRQHKIKCNASENFPASCSRCKRMGLQCQIDPQFRPKKGSQLQNLKNEIEELKSKLEFLLRSEGILYSVMKNSELGRQILQVIKSQDSPQHAGISVQTFLASEPELLKSDSSINSNANTPLGSISSVTECVGAGNYSAPPLLNDSAPPNSSKKSLPPGLQMALKYGKSAQDTSVDSPSAYTTPVISPEMKKPVVATTNTMQLLPSPYANIDEFVLGDVHISIQKANELHSIFVNRYLRYFPIMTTDSVTGLYSQSQLLFWTVMLTACLSDPEPTLYNSLASLIKQLAIETCWLRTPRSTHISQALLILCTWPLPNQKVLDDCSYRFVGLAKSLSFQLGLHRGEFMSEFTRTQALMPDAEKWRTRTWLGIFFAEQCWSSVLGLPSPSKTDYFIEKARLEGLDDLPEAFRQLICIAHFQAKLYNTMGSSTASQDGLLDPTKRASSLSVLEWELSNLDSELRFYKYPFVEIYYLYAKLMVCCFAFLPDTPPVDQAKYVNGAYIYATRIITLLTKLLEEQQLIELPIYVRQSATYAALILFKLHLTPHLPEKQVDSARQSIVTVHRLYRNQLTAWATIVENDISRTASVLEKLNFVLITHPEIFVEKEGIISRMRSHLTGTLFYDLVYCVHEARRRQMGADYSAKIQENENDKNDKPNLQEKHRMARRPVPLPFYNQISKEDFETITKTTPGGTAVTTLVPTKNAIMQAMMLQRNQGGDKGQPITAIKGIPLSMLDATGSVTMGMDSKACNNDLSQQPAKVEPSSQEGLTVSLKALNSAKKTTSPSRKNSSRKDRHMAQTGPSATNLAMSIPLQRSVSAFLAESLPFRRHTIPKHTSESITSGQTNSLFSYGPCCHNPTDVREQPPLKLKNTTMTAPVTGAEPTIMNRSMTAEPSYSNLNMFFDVNDSKSINAASNAMVCEAIDSPAAVGDEQPQNNQSPSEINNQLSELDTFFLQQSAGWIEGSSINDDFLGWYDINMMPEF